MQSTKINKAQVLRAEVKGPSRFSKSAHRTRGKAVLNFHSAWDNDGSWFSGGCGAGDGVESGRGEAHTVAGRRRRWDQHPQPPLHGRPFLSG